MAKITDLNEQLQKNNSIFLNTNIESLKKASTSSCEPLKESNKQISKNAHKIATSR